MNAPTSWTPNSWRSRPIRHQPTYDDLSRVRAVLSQLRSLPPLIAPGEVDQLRVLIARAAAGRRFILQGGDCAERFIDCAAQPIENKLKILLQMSVVLTWGAQMPVVRIGRMAGQFAKPRSKPTEVIDGREVLTYRGDHINGFDPSQRRPDPHRMLRAYHHAAATLNYVRALLAGGFADLHHPETWDLDVLSEPGRRQEYAAMVERISEAMRFMDAVGAPTPTFRRVELFTSHDGLLLPYEEAMTRQLPDGRWMNLGAHFLWIGDRTRTLDHAHVEYFRGVVNPIGVKVGPTMTRGELVELLDALDPEHTPGRITLITRYGVSRVADLLPGHIAAVQKTGRAVAWSCDPMHGNTHKTSGGVKTRDFDDILGELETAFAIHRASGSALAGVHFEMTGEDVTECTGGPQGLTPEDLQRSYETFCDPRLNYAQSLEVAFRVAQRLQARRQKPYSSR